MIVYRIEKDGVGPYRNWDIDLIDMTGEDNVHNDSNHPSPWEDAEISSITMDYLCACPSLEKLREWFDGYLEILDENGFNIYRIKVKKRILGKSKRQCFFKKEDIISKKVVNLQQIKIKNKKKK